MTVANYRHLKRKIISTKDEDNLIQPRESSVGNKHRLIAGTSTILEIVLISHDIISLYFN